MAYNSGPSAPSVAKEFTILLLGETGVGKSTFINAFVNYIIYKTMDEATVDPKCLIPVSFTMSDEDPNVTQTVTLGQQSDTENTSDTTKSATKEPRCYKFSTNDFVLKIVDTPGIADTNGVANDEINMKNLLYFISNYKEINAICVLLKPNNARVGVVFEYCLLELFRHLNKSAANNILFVFTNARATHYRPGDTGPALTKILTTIKQRYNVDIPYNKSTVFCFDNEAFRYLVAKSPPNCMTFDDDFKNDYEMSWQRSVKECLRLLEHIMVLNPHKVEDTISLNNVKQNILLLNKPLADISMNISDNMVQCKKRQSKIHGYTGDIKDLGKELYVPSKDIKYTSLDQPKTVCSDEKCTQKEIVNGNIKIHYINDCHKPCYLDDIQVLVIGDTGLQYCYAFHTGPQCRQCGHPYNTHLHLLVDTEVIQTEVRDNTISNKITTAEEASRAQQQQIHILETKIDELKDEKDAITKAVARFACFLKHNALTPVNDAFEEYIKHLIKREKSGRLDVLGDNSKTIQELEQLLNQYHIEKQIFIKVINESDDDDPNITPAVIDKVITDLCQLKHNGPTIRQALDAQKQSQRQSHRGNRETEYKVPKTSIFTNKFKNLSQKFGQLAMHSNN